MRDAAPLLSLLGHELRAPAGVLGGYLALIDRGRERLSADQQQAMAGARRAQERLVEILDDAGRLVSTWQAQEAVPHALALGPVLAHVSDTASAQGLALTIDAPPDGWLRAGASSVALGEAIVAVAAAVAREHGTRVTIAVGGTEPESTTLQIRAAGTGESTPAAAAVREPFNAWRPGLGLRLVVAATVLADAGARLDEVLVQATRVGVDITFAGA